MGKKTEALLSIETALKELQTPEKPAPVDFDLVFSTAEKAIVVAGVGALVVIAGVLVRLAWMFSHPDDRAWKDAWEGSGRDTLSYKQLEHEPPEHSFPREEEE